VFGLELSIPLLIVSVVQALGLGAQSIFDARIRENGIFTNRTYIGVALLAYNFTHLYNGYNANYWDAIFFALLCGFVSALFFENELKTRWRFIIVASLSSVVFALILLLTYRVHGIAFFDRFLLLGGVMNVYVIVVSIKYLIRMSRTEMLRQNAANLIFGTVFIVLSFVTLLSEDPLIHGVLTINALFVGLVILDYVKYFFFPQGASIELLDGGVTANQDNVRKTMLQTYGLTKREMEVALLVLKNYDTPEISEALNISENAVYQAFHRVKNRTESKSKSDFIKRFT